jgi:hypothetical protein
MMNTNNSSEMNEIPSSPNFPHTYRPGQAT